jgi:hypothetical protein
MNARHAILLVLLCLVVPAISGATITITADRHDYYFSPGEPAEIPLTATSDYAADIPGTVQVSIARQLQKPGVVMISTSNRVYPFTVQPGRSFLNITQGASADTQDLRVNISFYYADPAQKAVFLPEIILHFGAGTGPAGTLPAPLTGSGGAFSGDVPLSSSVSITEQPVSVQQQAAHDGTVQQVSGTVLAQPDAEALRQQQEREEQEREAERSAFEDRLSRDPLVRVTNESLAAQGFTRQELDAQPSTNSTGTFSMVYRKGADGQAILRGSMLNGTVPSVLETSNRILSADPALDANTTFLSYTGTLAGGGYLPEETSINRSLLDATVTMTYHRADSVQARINATITRHEVQSVSLDTVNKPIPLVLAAVILGAAAVLGACGVFLYRRYLVLKRMGPDAGVSSDVDGDPSAYRREARHLLDAAGLAFEQDRFPEAYGLTGQALRLFLAHEYGHGGELTGSEILEVVRARVVPDREIETILDRCCDVEFAKGQPGAAEFAAMIAHLRAMIGDP